MRLLINEFEERAANCKSNAEYDKHDPQLAALHMRESQTYQTAADFIKRQFIAH